MAGANSYILLDSAASETFFSMKFAKRIGIFLGQPAGSVELGDGSESTTFGKINVHVRLGQYQSHVPCTITELGNGYDLILGEPWLKKHGVHMNFETANVVIRKGKQIITVKSRDVPKEVNLLLPKMLTTMQLKREVQKGSGMFLVQLQTVLPENTEVQGGKPKSAEVLIHEFSDVFAPLPPGLPPEHAIGHTIPLEAESKPPY